MVKAVLRGLAAAALAVLPVTVSSPAHAAQTLPLAEAVAGLPVATESRDGYDRNKFRHWNTGDDAVATPAPKSSSTKRSPRPPPAPAAV